MSGCRIAGRVGVGLMGSACCLGQLEQVVACADHCPLVPDLFEAAQEELSEASDVLDLAEDGFGGLLSQSVAASSAGAGELDGHGGDARAGSGSSPAGGMGLAVPGPAGGDVGVDAPAR